MTAIIFSDATAARRVQCFEAEVRLEIGNGVSLSRGIQSATTTFLVLFGYRFN